MKNKIVLGSLLSLILLLGVSLPGTLTNSADTEGTEIGFDAGTIEDDKESPDTLLVNHENNYDIPVTYIEPASKTEANVDIIKSPSHISLGLDLCNTDTDSPVCSYGTQSVVKTETHPLYESSAKILCSCNSNDGIHNVGCPLYAAPIETELPTESVHINAYTEVTTDETYDSRSHEQNLYGRLMACASPEEVNTVLDEVAEEELNALSYEENLAVSAHIESFEPEPLPTIIIDGSDNETVLSEIVYPTVSFTNVAPFGSPVVGGAN